jgi:ElaB/YqjD/DUF883 family membrane-anchored ribosome-binding protein
MNTSSSSFQDQATDQAHRATSKASDVAHRAADKGGQAVDRAVDKAGDWTDAAREEVRENPGWAVLGALAAGWLIGRFMSH